MITNTHTHKISSIQRIKCGLNIIYKIASNTYMKEHALLFKNIITGHIQKTKIWNLVLKSSHVSCITTITEGI